MHVDSLLWCAGLLWVVAAVYRRLCRSPLLAGLTLELLLPTRQLMARYGSGSAGARSLRVEATS
jgi:hypothetical protein